VARVANCEQFGGSSPVLQGSCRPATEELSAAKRATAKKREKKKEKKKRKKKKKKEKKCLNHATCKKYPTL
jgi:hypothetical protein